MQCPRGVCTVRTPYELDQASLHAASEQAGTSRSEANPAAAYRLTPPHSCGPCAKILPLVSSGKKEREKSSNKKARTLSLKREAC